MSNNAVNPRLRPDPFDVFTFAGAAVEVRYRLVLNYVKAEPEAGEPPPPRVVRRVFNQLLHVTELINDGRPEDRKLEGHVIAARALVERFEREWLSNDHRTRLANKEAHDVVSEFTEYDWASIRRNPSADEDFLPLAGLDAELLNGSPFRVAAWADYEKAVEEYVDTFDPPCRTLYRLVRVLAEVYYPDPATYDATLGTLPVRDNEYLIKPRFHRVRQLIDEFQTQTCFNLNAGDWFAVGDPLGSTTRLFTNIGEVLRGWRGEVPVPTELDRPRRELAPLDNPTVVPAKPRWDVNEGKLWYKDKIAKEFHERGENTYAILNLFEAAKWEGTINDPNIGAVRNKRYNLRNLNKNLKYIRFIGAGSSLGIRWEKR